MQQMNFKGEFSTLWCYIPRNVTLLGFFFSNYNITNCQLSNIFSTRLFASYEYENYLFFSSDLYPKNRIYFSSKQNSDAKRVEI